MFFYRYKAQACRGDLVVAEGIGSCSSWEKKYRYRNAQRICPACGQATIIKGKAEYGGGWLCFAKKGGCGAKFTANDPAIIDQEVGQTMNPDPADIVNTVDKMAQKRAIIAAVLLACNASEYFTQDVEDYIDGSFEEHRPEPQAKPEAKTQPATPITQEPVEADFVPTMTLEFAENEMNSAKPPVRYGDLPTDKLAFMATKLAKSLKEAELTAQEREDKQRKLDACKTILHHRASQTDAE